MKCQYDRVHPTELKDMPQGSCIRFFCRDAGEVREGKFCSYHYDDAAGIQLNVQENSQALVVGGTSVFMRKKKGTHAKEEVDIALLQEEIALLRQELAGLHEKMGFVTKAIKLLRLTDRMPRSERSKL